MSDRPVLTGAACAAPALNNETEFALNRAMDVQVFHIGNEKQPVLVVDNLVKTPQSLLAYARSDKPFQPDKTNFYPGVRKPLPVAYARCMADGLCPTLCEVFDLAPEARPDVVLCALSIATTPPQKLIPIQRIPHFDTPDADQVAVVHYLCPPGYGGTSFYRHRRTGYEVISEERFGSYTKTLERQATTVGMPRAAYINGDTALFERIAVVEAKFNRAIFYRSNVLHSGNIEPGNGLSDDPCLGRLTATAFIRFGA